MPKATPDSAQSVRTSSRASFAVAGIAGAIILALVGLGIYSNSFDGPFAFDDATFIIDNPGIQRLWPPSSPKGRNRPVGFLSFAANYAYGKLDVRGYHVVNLGIHLTAACLLFGVVRQTLSRGRMAQRYSNHATALGLAVALLWMAHPLQTQAVTYVYQRLESLMGLFYLATLWCFIRSLDSRWRGLWLAASIVCCLLGMGTKEVMVTAPLMVLWYDRVFAARSWRELWQARWLYYTALAGTWVFLAWLMLTHTDGYELSGVLVVPGLTPLTYASSQVGVILNYLRLTFWPDNLCLDYDWQPPEHAIEIIAPGLVIGCLVIATVWSAYRWPVLGFLGGWFFVILAPTSSVAPLVDLAFEHRMYLPLAAVAALVVVGGFSLWEWARRRFGLRDSWPARAVLASIVIAATAALGCRTYARNNDYSTSVRIWESTVQQRPNSPRAHTNYAVALTAEGRNDEAMDEVNIAISLKPEYADPRFHRGLVHKNRKEYKLAIADISEALRISPKRLKLAYMARAQCWAKLGNHKAAIADFTAAIESSPDDWVPYQLRSQSYLAPEEQSLALADLSKAIELSSDDPHLYNSRGSSYERFGKLNEAVADYNQAIRLDPDFAAAYYNRGLAQAQLGRSDLARADFNKALELAPRFAAAYHYRGELERQAGKNQDAIADYAKALEIEPERTDFLNHRARAYFAAGDFARSVEDSNRVLALDPKNVEALRDRGKARVEMLEYERAVQDFSQAIEIAKGDPETFVHRGGAYAKLLKFELAGKDYQHALDLNPKSEGARGNLDQLNNLVSRLQAEIDKSTKAIEANPKDRAGFLGRARVYAQLQEYDRAIDDCTKLIELDPGDFDAYGARGALYWMTGRPELADADYGKALELKPEQANLYYSRAVVRVAMREYQQAVDDCSEAIRLNDRYAVAYGQRGRLRATCPDAAVRDGAKAIADATRACELSNTQDIGYLDTLAAAYAEAGDFAKAIEWESKALELKRGSEAFRQAAKERLDRYREGKPYREPAEE